MPRIEVDLPTPDGPCHATLHVPADGLPAPAAILFPDAAGPRETFRAVADRLAADGLHRAAAGRPPSVGRVAAVRRRDGVLGPAGAGSADDDGAQRHRGDDHPGRRGVPRVPRGPPRGGRPRGSACSATAWAGGPRCSSPAGSRTGSRPPRRSTGAGWPTPPTRTARISSPTGCRRRCTSPPQRTTRRSRPSSTRAWRPRTPRRECGTRWRSIPRRTGSRYRTTRRTTRRRTSGTGRR